MGLFIAWFIWLKLLKISDLTINSKRTDLLYLWGWVFRHLQTVAQSYETYEWLTGGGGRGRLSLCQYNTCLRSIYLPLLISANLWSWPEKCGRFQWVWRGISHGEKKKKVLYFMKTWSKVMCWDSCTSFELRNRVPQTGWLKQWKGIVE